MKHNVEVCKSPEKSRAYYRNLVVCGRVWQCPVCASTITEKRRIELTAALAENTYSAALLTFTLQHNAGDNLKGMLTALIEAHRALKSGRAWQDFKREFGWIGSITSLEVTHGANGWHVHKHELGLFNRPLDHDTVRAMENHVKRQWQERIRRQGYNADWKHGATAETTTTAIKDYVAKFGHEPVNTRWTVERELTKSPTKKGKRKGRTPLQLLSDYGEGDKKAGVLFREYHCAFKGRNQLVWSPGLRKLLGLGADKDDLELAAETDASGKVLASLTRAQWKIVCETKNRAQLLDFASKASPEDLESFINDLVNCPA